MDLVWIWFVNVRLHVSFALQTIQISKWIRVTKAKPKKSALCCLSGLKSAAQMTISSTKADWCQNTSALFGVNTEQITVQWHMFTYPDQFQQMHDWNHSSCISGLCRSCRQSCTTQCGENTSSVTMLLNIEGRKHLISRQKTKICFIF